MNFCAARTPVASSDVVATRTTRTTLMNADFWLLPKAKAFSFCQNHAAAGAKSAFIRVVCVVRVALVSL